MATTQITDERMLSKAGLAAAQAEAWERTWRHVWAHSPFYREHLRRAGLSPRKPLSLDQLAVLPPIDKTTLSENTAAFLCVPRKQIVEVVTTSGSTGQPLVYMLTESDLRRLALNEYYSFGCAGFSAADTVVLAVTLDRCFIAGMAYWIGLRMLGAAVVRIGPATPLMHLDLLRRVQANAVVGVPSFLALLADKAAETGLDPAALGLRKAVCIGEPIRNANLTLNRAGETLTRRWGAQVFSTYGNTELASSLCECGTGCGGHLHPTLLHLEALDEAGQPVPDGEVGELTATTLGVEAMPLVRYRTGDFAAIYRERCLCGRRTLRIGPIVGRASHKLKLKGTTIFPSTFQAVLETTPAVAAYVIVARSDGALSDHVEVRVACVENPEKVMRGLRERFQGEAKVTPEISVATAAEIEALQLPEGARKRRVFVDLRQ